MTNTSTPTSTFNPSTIATIALFELTDATGRHPYLFRGGTYLQPTDIGEWRAVPQDTIDRHLAATITRLGYDPIDPRVRATATEFAALLAAATADQVPHVDPVAVCTPSRPGLPPKTWPVAPDPADIRRTAQAWTRARCYGLGGRQVVVVYGGVLMWSATGREWRRHPGTREWLEEEYRRWTGQNPPPMFDQAARDVLSTPGSGFATPGDVAAFDLRRAIAVVDDAQQLHYRNRLTPLDTNGGYVDESTATKLGGF